MKKSTAIIAVCCGLLLAGCNPGTLHENILIVPDDYRGPIILILVEGTPQAFTTVEQQRSYVIPASGILCVGSFDNFIYGWGMTIARYATGAQLAQVFEFTDLDVAFADPRFMILGQKGSTTREYADGRTEELSDSELLFAIGSSGEIRNVWKAWHEAQPSFKRDWCGR